METIILASSSPRRKEILSMLSVPFVAIHPDIDESIYDGLPPGARVTALSLAKARQGESLVRGAQKENKGRLLLAADTLVALREGDSWRVIGKPRSREDARTMLGALASKTHRVFTALCLLDLRGDLVWQALSESKVSFAPMSPKEIELYLKTDEWQGVAGAYRVQGRGAWFIESIDGSPSGVMGLPIHELYGILKQSGYDFA